MPEIRQKEDIEMHASYKKQQVDAGYDPYKNRCVEKPIT